MKEFKDLFIDYQMNFYYEIEQVKEYYKSKGFKPKKINKILKIQEEFNEKLAEFLEKTQKN